MTVSKPPLPLLALAFLLAAALAAACFPARAPLWSEAGMPAYMAPEQPRAAVAEDLRDASVAPSSSPARDLIPVLAPLPPGTWTRYDDCFAAGGTIARFIYAPDSGWATLECFRVREAGRTSLHPIPLDGEL